MKVKALGFTLIEAMVALVILSLMFSAVWGWFGSATKSTSRIEQAISLPQVFEQFLVYIDLEPLDEVRAGVFKIEEFDVYWKAEVEKQSDQQNYRRQPAWIVALYNVSIDIKKDGQSVTELTTKVVRQYQDPNYVDFSQFQ